MKPSFGSRLPVDASAFWIGTALAIGVFVSAAFSRGDASWDFRNYHLYGAFAFLNKEHGVDVAPAHLQTFFSPMLDLFYYFIGRAVQMTPVANVLIAIPHAIAVVLAFVLTCRLAQAHTVAERLLVAAAVVVAATGAATGSTIATSMSEMLPAALFVLALLALIRTDLRTAPCLRQVFTAGLLAGAACGFKLTFSYAAIGLALSMLTVPPGLRAAPLRLVVLGLGGAVGAVAVNGYWWGLQIAHYGNPVFPMLNDIFKSPLAPPFRYVDETYLPRSLAQALEAPWAWVLRLYHGAGESWLRDPRFALGVVAALAILAQSLAMPTRVRRNWPTMFVAVWFLISFVLWRFQFSIFRYLSVLELLTGPLLVLVALPWIRSVRAVRPAIAGMAVLLVMLLQITVYPYVQRSPRGTRLWDVDLGPLDKHAVVLLLDNEPMGYLAAFTHKEVRFVATNDFFMSLDRSNPMQAQTEAAITGQTGELWGLESPVGQPDRADQTLSRYRLARGECRDVRSNLSPEPIRLCRLERRPPDVAASR